MMYNVLRDLYDQDITPDQKFMDIFISIFNEDLDRDLWPIKEVAKIYEKALNTKDEENEYLEPIEPEEDEFDYATDADEPEEDELSKIQKQSSEKEGVPTLNQLLDKISDYGYDSL